MKVLIQIDSPDCKQNDRTNMADVEDDIEEYTKFDDLALGVMQRNHSVLEQERDEAMEMHKTTPAVEFRFDIYSPNNETIREQHGVVCQLDIRDVLQRAWRRQQGEEDLPSPNCYIERIGIEDATNDFPSDVFLSCRQSERIGGTFARGKLSGDSAGHDASHHLWVIHAGDKCAYPDDGRTIYSAQDFVEGATPPAALVEGATSFASLTPFLRFGRQDVSCLLQDARKYAVYSAPRAYSKLTLFGAY